MDKKIQPRGIRNCNPLNIIKGYNWKGLRPEQTDSKFCQFESMFFGWRAALILLRNYIEGRTSSRVKYNTIEKVINRWAPITENATQRYIDNVAEDLGIDPRETFSFSDKEIICQMVASMAFVECGHRFDVEDIESVYDCII